MLLVSRPQVLSKNVDYGNSNFRNINLQCMRCPVFNDSYFVEF